MNNNTLDFDMVDLAKYLAHQRPYDQLAQGYDVCVAVLMNYFEDKLQLKVIK